MTLRVGLTGSIGMGKSTTAAMFADLGFPVWNADAAVHRSYAPGGASVAAIRDLHPQAVVNGAVDRGALRDWIACDSAALGQIERAVHPLVAEDRAAFVQGQGAPVVILDIPLLFETGGDVDFTIVVSAPASVQRARVLARPGMTGQTFDRILARQMPDAEKRARADAVIATDTMDDARAQVEALAIRLREIADA